ncbi:glycosyltransferase [Microbacterium sp. NPDC076911]|uniref:glycosyltransferase n=1 Tax=Microbacterium sp. NPDC076911 TaxID=3154958 RepID=UPI00341FF997
MTAIADAAYLVLSSRLVPGLDGGYTVATLARARSIQDAGATAPLLLTLDPATPSAHAEHRRVFADRGEIASVDRMRNLFDEALADPSWVRAAAVPGEPSDGVEYREIASEEAGPVLSIPVIAANPDWHLTDAAVVVHGYGVIPGGFGALYLTWLQHVAAELRADDPERVVVVICESRQLGELIAGWSDPHVRIIHTVHNSHLEPPYEDPNGPINGLWTRWFDVVDRFDAVLWPTAAQRADVEARFGARDTFAVVPNPVEQVHSHGTRTDATDPHRVVMLGRIAAQKRVDLAVRAWARIIDAVPDAHLDIYGDGPLKEQIAELIDELALAASITLHGHIDDRDAALAGAALMLVSTAYEGQGLSIAEALVRGLPVVSFDVRYGPRETIGDAGVLVPPGDVEALADVVIALLSNDERRAALADRAVEQGRLLAPEAVTCALVPVLKRVLATPSRRAH